MGSGLLKQLLGIQDPQQVMQMRAHALDMQIKQAQLQKLLAGEPRDALAEQTKREQLQAAMAKQSAIATLGGGGMGAPSALAQYAPPMQTGGAHLNEDGSEVSSPEQEAIWQQNNGGYSTGGIQIDQLPPPALSQFAPPEQQAAPSALAQYGAPQLPPDQLQAIATVAPAQAAEYLINKPKRDQDYIKNQREAAMQQTDLSKAFSTYAEENLRSKQLLDKVMPQVSNWTAGAGSLLKYIPGTGARDLEANVDTLRAGELIDALKQLKQESPNGASGLGALTDKEGSALKALRANLETTQSPEQLKENMSKLSEFMDKSFERVSKAYEEHQKAFGAQGSPVLDATKAERKQYQDSRSALEAELAKRGLKVKK